MVHKNTFLKEMRYVRSKIRKYIIPKQEERKQNVGYKDKISSIVSFPTVLHFSVRICDKRRRWEMA